MLRICYGKGGVDWKERGFYTIIHSENTNYFLHQTNLAVMMRRSTPVRMGGFL